MVRNRCLNSLKLRRISSDLHIQHPSCYLRALASPVQIAAPLNILLKYGVENFLVIV